VRGFAIFLGLLLLLGGGAVAGAQFAPVDVSTIPALDPVFSSLPGSREFLKTEMALYSGGGAAVLGLLLIVVGVATGGKKQARPAPKSPEMPGPRMARPAGKPAASATPQATDPPPAPVNEPPVPYQPPTAAPKPAPRVASPQTLQPSAPAQDPQPAAPPVPPPVVSPVPQLAAAPVPPQDPVPPQGQAKAKPQASGQPPAGANPGAPPPDPRMVNRKRVQDLVTINDALKAYHAKNGGYPKADGLAGANERGAAWIPGLSPEFLAAIPRDPVHDAGTQYVYVSDGANYKLLAQGASLVGSGNVEVLGVKIDQTRNPTLQNAAFGFWTTPFAGA